MLIFRSFLSGERIGLGPSEDGGVYVRASSLSLRQPLAAVLARDVSDGIPFVSRISVSLDGMLYSCFKTLPLLFMLLWLPGPCLGRRRHKPPSARLLLLFWACVCARKHGPCADQAPSCKRVT